MKRERILAIIMSVFMALSLLPTMVFAAEAGTPLDGKLKIKGTVAVGTTLSADFTKVQPEGITEENVSFLWSRKTGEEEELLELSREKTYKVADEDLGCKIVLKVTGLEEQGFAGSLTVTSDQVAATAEEAEAAAGGDETAQPETEPMPEATPETEIVPEEIPETEIVPEEIPEAEPMPEEIPEEASQEEELVPIPEPQGDGGEEILDTPDDMNWDHEEYGETEDDGWSEEDMEQEELFPITVSSSTENEGTENAGIENAGEEEEPGSGEVTYGAELYTEDGSGVLDFGTLEYGAEASVQYITVRNTGSGILNFEEIAPEHFMVQDIEEGLKPDAEVSLWIQPREGISEGSYDDTITYITKEGVSVSVQAKLTVRKTENTDPGMETPGAADPVQTQLTVDSAAFEFDTEGYSPDSVTAKEITVTNTGSTEVTLTMPALQYFTIVQKDGNTDLSLSPGGSRSFSILPAEGLAGQDEAYTETFTFGTEGDASVTTEEITASVKVEALSVSVVPDQSSVVFDTVTEGYGEIPEKTITLTNQGNTGVTLGEIEVEEQFEILSKPGNNVLNMGDSTTFTIRPKTGLLSGNYTGTVLIYKDPKDAGVLASVDVSFTVEAPAPVYELAAAPADLDFGTLEAGYGEAPAAQTVTLTNRGTAAVNLKQPGAGNFTVGALGKAVLQPGESTAFTVRPKTGLGENTYEETVQISASEGVSANVHVIFRVTAKTIKLESIQKPSDIAGLKNGTKKSAEALKLPSTVTIQTSNGKMKAKVGWDVKGCSYNPSSTEKQTFTVKGKVTLPDGIENPKKIGLTISVKVTVNGYSAKIASKENNKITGISSDGEYTTQSKISFTAVGAGMDNTKPGKGDTRYLPLNWKVINTNSWSAAPYTATFGLAQSGDYTLSVVFNQQKFDGSNWVNTGEQDTKKVSFTVVKAKVTGVPGQDLTPAAKRTDANRKASVKTGDNTKIAPFVIALIIAAGCAAGVIIYRKKK